MWDQTRPDDIIDGKLSINGLHFDECEKVDPAVGQGGYTDVLV